MVKSSSELFTIGRRRILASDIAFNGRAISFAVANFSSVVTSMRSVSPFPISFFLRLCVFNFITAMEWGGMVIVALL